MESQIKNLIGALVFVVIGLSLTPIVATFTTNAQGNLTSNAAASTMVGLIPLFYVIGVLATTVAMLVLTALNGK